MLQIAIDTGGTFTDGALLREDGTYAICKTPTTPDDVSVGITDCIKLLAQDNAMPVEQMLAKTDTLIVSSTVAKDAVLQLKGAKVGMITTRGFRDVLEMRRIAKSEVYNLRLPKPVILVPRYLRIGVTERIKYTGEIITPLDEDEVLEAAAKLKAHNVEVIAVCLLHSYINPGHERRAREIVLKAYPGTEVVLSSTVLPQPMEFERFNTTVLAAYITPKSKAFLKGLDNRLKEAGFKGSLLHITPNAALCTTEVALERPIFTLEAGPSATPLFASATAKEAGLKNAIVADIGGTSFGISVVPEGRILTTTEGMIGDQRNACETADIVTAGAGGGAIAWLDRRGVLRLGPGGAGADPGPACYGKNGQKPTFTDACVILGYIPHDNFMGGKFKLDVDLANKAIKENIADPMHIDTIEAADAIYSLGVTLMAAETLITCSDRGYSISDFVLFAAGACAPTPILDIAKKLDIREVYVPKIAPVSNAYGMMYADFKYDASRCILKLTNEVEPDELNNIYREMKEELLNIIEKEGVSRRAVSIRYGANIRFYGQTWEACVWLSEVGQRPINDGDLKELTEEFYNTYQETYGRSARGMVTEIVSIRMVATGIRTKPRVREVSRSGKDLSAALKRRQPVYFKQLGGFVEVPCYYGDKVRYGDEIPGPARIEEKAMNLIVPPGSTVTVDRYGNYRGRVD